MLEVAHMIAMLGDRIYSVPRFDTTRMNQVAITGSNTLDGVNKGTELKFCPRR